MVQDPIRVAGFDAARKPKRFYSKPGLTPCEGGFALTLDGRVAKTPAKAPLVLPTREAAEALAAEWAGQEDEIDFAAMPITRIANAAIDAVASKRQEVAQEIVGYAETDLVCYRAEGPEKLVKAEAEAWDPVLAFAAARLGARFICSEGITHVEQPRSAVAAVRAKVEEIARAAPVALACLSVMTSLTGSVLIALALAEGAISLEEAWRAAHVDEDYQIAFWGADPEAVARRERRFAEMAAAERLWRLTSA
ncbi:MAG TPA: ATP12 family protein [Methylovirgula sp.]|nr:ATP12 family protein [Methylovirgula sp.]